MCYLQTENSYIVFQLFMLLCNLSDVCYLQTENSYIVFQLFMLLCNLYDLVA